GFPIAKIATKLAIGYTLDEIPNDITGQTPASFEPALDYVVVKIPRFAFEKFPGADPTLTTHMKSAGEALAGAPVIYPWFVEQLDNINETAAAIASAARLDLPLLREAKAAGFSDAAIADLRALGADEVRALRHSLGL